MEQFCSFHEPSQQETLLIIMNLAMGMPTPEGADAAMPNLPEAMAGINPRKSI